MLTIRKETEETSYMFRNNKITHTATAVFSGFEIDFPIVKFSSGTMVLLGLGREIVAKTRAELEDKLASALGTSLGT